MGNPKPYTLKPKPPQARKQPSEGIRRLLRCRRVSPRRAGFALHPLLENTRFRDLGFRFSGFRGLGLRGLGPRV